MDFQTLITHNSFLAYLTSGAVGGLLGGLLLLGLQTLLKQGVAYQYKKKLQEMKNNNDLMLRNIGYEYDKKLKQFNHEYDEKLRTLNYHYDKQLASFNAEIIREAEKGKEDFQRKIHDFTLYSKKRHEIYPELFKGMGKLFYDIKYIDAKAFLSEEMVESKRELVMYFEELDILPNERFKRQIEKYYDEYEENGDFRKCCLQLNDALRNRLTVELAKEFGGLEDYRAGSLLYLSDEVSEKSGDFIKGLGYLISPTILAPYLSEEVDLDLLKKNMDDALEDLKQVMKRELSVGDYSMSGSP
ncbi:hypothetical protein [Priestia megaterium]|uniref:hypothetical protein n=1 Tax=Priestia megaterium TaxID=1404 RepID=UPI0011B66859|nr:hypothetical protein [Priestia megaterium]QDZ88694.1 hypothetical protein D0441_31140 [Priestia megaterium]